MAAANAELAELLTGGCWAEASGVLVRGGHIYKHTGGASKAYRAYALTLVQRSR